MKTTKITSFATFMLVVLFSLSSLAQPGLGKGMCNIPDLSEEQQKKIDELMVPHQKEMLMLRNQIQEKKAHLQTLTSADNADMASINKTIDEMGAMKIDKMKKVEKIEKSKYLPICQRT